MVTLFLAELLYRAVVGRFNWPHRTNFSRYFETQALILSISVYNHPILEVPPYNNIIRDLPGHQVRIAG